MIIGELWEKHGEQDIKIIFVQEDPNPHRYLTELGSTHLIAVIEMDKEDTILKDDEKEYPNLQVHELKLKFIQKQAQETEVKAEEEAQEAATAQTEEVAEAAVEVAEATPAEETVETKAAQAPQEILEQENVEDRLTLWQRIKRFFKSIFS